LNLLWLVIGVVTVFVIVVGWLVAEAVQKFLAKQRATITQTARTGLADMFIFVDPLKLFYYNVIALAVVPVIVWLATENLVFVVLSAAAIVFMPKWAVNYLRKQRFSRFEAQLPDALLMVSGAMRAGASLTVALESMVSEQKPPLSQEFELLLREQRLGVDFDTALRNMEKRLPIQDFIMVVAGLRISREVGGNLAEILETLAETLRRKFAMEGKIKSLTAQGKMQGIVMTSLPLLLMLVLSKMEPEAMHPLFHSVAGWGTLGVIAVMELLGYWAIRKITTIDI